MSLQINLIPANRGELSDKGQKTEAAPGFESLLLVGTQMQNPLEANPQAGGMSADKQQVGQATAEKVLPFDVAEPEAGNSDQGLGANNGESVDSRWMMMQLQQQIQGQSLSYLGMEQQAEATAASAAQVDSTPVDFAQLLPSAAGLQSGVQLQGGGGAQSQSTQAADPEQVQTPVLIDFASTLQAEPVDTGLTGINVDTGIDTEASVGLDTLPSQRVVPMISGANAQHQQLGEVVFQLPVDWAGSLAVEGQPTIGALPSAVSTLPAIQQAFELPTDIVERQLSGAGGEDLQKVAAVLVKWSAIASGRLSQAYQVSGQVPLAVSSYQTGETARTLLSGHSALAVSEMPGGELKERQQARFVGQYQLAQSADSKRQDSEKRNAAVAAKQSSALHQSQIMPQKITWSEQLQKMWVRDYFMSEQQTEQLLHTVKQGFDSNGQVRTLVLNGHIIYQAGGKR